MVSLFGDDWSFTMVASSVTRGGKRQLLNYMKSDGKLERYSAEESGQPASGECYLVARDSRPSYGGYRSTRKRGDMSTR
jgi:hypothetical protein